MRTILKFWWDCAKIAARGGSQFANDWQWVYGSPLLSIIVAGYAGVTSQDGSVMLIQHHPILNGITIGAIVFALTWVAGVLLQMPIISARKYQFEKERGEALAERLTPRFRLLFSQANVEYERIAQQGFGSGVLGARYVRIVAEAITDSAVENFCAAITGFAIKYPNLDYYELPAENIPISEPKNLIPGMPLRLDILTTNDQQGQLKPTPNISWPHRLNGSFLQTATFRFDITANGSGITQRIRIEVDWDGRWDHIIGRKIEVSE